MPAAGAGCRTRRIEQHGVEQCRRLPRQCVGLDHLGGETGPRKVLIDPLEPPRAGIERGNLPAGCRQLQRLATRRCAQIEHRAAITDPEQPRGQARGQILHPPAALIVAFEILHRRAAAEPDMTGHQRSTAQPLGPGGGLGGIAQGQIERGQVAQPGRDGLRPLAPAQRNLSG